MNANEKLWASSLHHLLIARFFKFYLTLSQHNSVHKKTTMAAILSLVYGICKFVPLNIEPVTRRCRMSTETISL